MTTERYIQFSMACLLLSIAASALRAQDRTLQDPDEGKQIAVLTSDADLHEKIAACRELARVGTRQSVPVLAQLLANDKLSHMARNALEGIPDPSAADALREALGTTRGKLLAGVIGSCGRKRDTKAVDAIAKFLDDSDSDVAYAAAYALGKIANAPAAAALEKALGSAPAAARPMIAEGCLMCAESLAADGKQDAAVAIYDRVGAADLPGRTRIAAMRGSILARGAKGIPLLVEQLKADSPQMLAAALRVAMEVPGAELTRAMAAQIPNLPEAKATLVMQALGNRGDVAALQPIMAIAQNGPAKLRLVAINTVGQLADSSVVPGLFDIASGDAAELARAAQQVLAAIPGKETDDALLAKLKAQDPKVRRVALAILGQRRVAAFMPQLIAMVADQDQEIRTSAIKALGDAASINELPLLIKTLNQPRSDADMQAAEAALSSACVRLADPDACASKIIDTLPSAAGPRKAAFLRVLRSIGGAKSLDAVRAATKDSDADVSDAATRVLCDWTSPAAAPDLLQLAKTSSNTRHQTLAFRGYVRLIASREVPPAQKITMCREARSLAKSDQEKRLVLGALSGIQNKQSLDMALGYLDDAAVKNEACNAAIQIAERMVRNNPAGAKAAMEKVLAATQDPEAARRAKAVVDQANRR